MKITEFTTSEGKFIGVTGLPEDTLGVFKQGEITYAYFINAKTVIEDLPEYEKVIGKMSMLDSADAWNIIGSTSVATGYFLFRNDPYIFKLSK